MFTLLKEASWRDSLKQEFDQPYMQELAVFLREQESWGRVVFPEKNKIFNALNLTPVNNIKVVILGQDPYHGEGQAHGLSFSVEKGVAIPPSLRNIYKELNADLACSFPEHGDLSYWAKQGVLLLNSVLTVEQSAAASHKKQGWEDFTDAIINVVNEQCENVVFLLWGAYAHKKGGRVDGSRHCVLESAHPSPLSARRGFIGCRHFSQANSYLTAKKRQPVDWQII